MSEFKIEKGIPVPSHRGAPSKYPWEQMEVGDSFFVPAEDTTKNFGSLARTSGKRMGAKFTSRKLDGGWRVWRIA